MIPYTGPFQCSQFMDAVLGGRIAQVDGQWYYTEWHVAYAQGPMDTSDNFVTEQQAEAHFQKRLADARGAWNHNGSRCSETPCDRPNGGKSIRFRPVLKNGKPGRLTGLLYMDRILVNARATA